MIEADDSEGLGPRRPVKSEAAFRTISEVSDDLEVPQHVLRFWESKFSQIRPLKRGGGRRYYRPEDVLLLRRIRDFLYMDGYTIRGVQKLLKDLPGKAEPRPAKPKLVEPIQELFASEPDFALEPELCSLPDPAFAPDPEIIPEPDMMPEPDPVSETVAFSQPLYWENPVAPEPAEEASAPSFPSSVPEPVAPALDRAALQALLAELIALRMILIEVRQGDFEENYQEG